VRLRKRHLPLIVLIGVFVAMLPSLASSATTATVEALNEPGSGLYNEERHFWSPNPVAVTTNGGVVTFANNSMTVPHGVVWKSTPATPVCEEGAGKVPVGLGHSGVNWHGACTFTQEGVYSYYCSVHGLAMSGTVYVNASGTPPPTATTGTATAISETEATLRGAINPTGQATSYYFNYGTTTGYGQKTAELPVGEDSSSHAVSATIAGLAPGTRYHFQLIATYASGASTVLGADQIFTTVSPPGAPTASTGAASAIGETGATLNGTVNPDGQATTYFFNYGTTSSYGHTTAVQPAGADSAGHIVSATIAGLLPGTVYHFELVAHNASGNAPGDDKTFTTTTQESPPPSETPTTTTTTPPPSPPATIASTPPAAPGAGSAPAGSTSIALKLAGAQHGSTIHGSLDISPAAAGGRLEVDLLTTTASLARKHAKQVRVGRFVRAAVAAGKVSFSVALNAQAKRALHRHHRLAVIVEVILTPPHGAPVTTTHSVALHG
jgi:plastocyanin